MLINYSCNTTSQGKGTKNKYIIIQDVECLHICIISKCYQLFNNFKTFNIFNRKLNIAQDIGTECTNLFYKMIYLTYFKRYLKYL